MLCLDPHISRLFVSFPSLTFPPPLSFFFSTPHSRIPPLPHSPTPPPAVSPSTRSATTPWPVPAQGSSCQCSHLSPHRPLVRCRTTQAPRVPTVAVAMLTLLLLTLAAWSGGRPLLGRHLRHHRHRRCRRRACRVRGGPVHRVSISCTHSRRRWHPTRASCGRSTSRAGMRLTALLAVAAGTMTTRTSPCTRTEVALASGHSKAADCEGFCFSSFSLLFFPFFPFLSLIVLSNWLGLVLSRGLQTAGSFVHGKWKTGSTRVRMYMRGQCKSVAEI